MSIETLSSRRGVEGCTHIAVDTKEEEVDEVEVAVGDAEVEGESERWRPRWRSGAEPPRLGGEAAAVGVRERSVDGDEAAAAGGVQKFGSPLG